MNEEQLIAGCKAGNRIAQKELYDRFSKKMLGVCFRYVNDMETARDLLQEGFVKVFGSIEMYLGLGSFEGWMRRISWRSWSRAANPRGPLGAPPGTA